MSLPLFSKREKVHIREGEEDIISKERRYIKEGESTPKERKREKSEDNSEGVAILLIKMKLIEGEYKFSFWHCLTILTWSI